MVTSVAEACGRFTHTFLVTILKGDNVTVQLLWLDLKGSPKMLQ